MTFSNFDFRFLIPEHSRISADSRVPEGRSRLEIEHRKSKFENSRSFRTTP
jgi:hypothetical protein